MEMEGIATSATHYYVGLIHATKLTSTLLIISCCMVTDSTGYLPAALSADNITGKRKENKRNENKINENKINENKINEDKDSNDEKENEYEGY